MKKPRLIAGYVTKRTLFLASGLFLGLGLYALPSCTPEASSRSTQTFAEAVHEDANTPELRKTEALAKDGHIQLLEMCLAHYRAVGYRDFTAKFLKQERIAGKLGPEEDTDVKFMDKPFSVALHWTRNAPPADRVIYVEGKWGGQMAVHPSSVLLSWVGTVLRPPAGPEAMEHSLHPITDIGFQHSLESLLSVYRQAEKAGDLKQEFGGYAQVGGRKTIVLIRYLPQTDKYPSYKTTTCIDLEYLVPVMIEGLDRDGQLVYRYVCTDIHFNTGLSAADFLPKANGMEDPG